MSIDGTIIYSQARGDLTPDPVEPINRLRLVFALDGVPYSMVRKLEAEGHSKGFYPPGRLISIFPSLTRPAFSKMLVGGRPKGYEHLSAT